MIDLYTWGTPNGRKAQIALAELDLPHTLHRVDIGKGEQFAPEFLRVAPNNKIPVIVDQDTGIRVMESGAILLYLADKSGRLMPAEPSAKWAATEWLMWQMSAIGPSFGQAHDFLRFNPGAVLSSQQRLFNEVQRLFGVLDHRLGEAEYLAGDQYSMADIATWPWISRFEWHQADLATFAHVRRWYLTLAERPAVQNGYAALNPGDAIPKP